MPSSFFHRLLQLSCCRRVWLSYRWQTSCYCFSYLIIGTSLSDTDLVQSIRTADQRRLPDCSSLELSAVPAILDCSNPLPQLCASLQQGSFLDVRIVMAWAPISSVDAPRMRAVLMLADPLALADARMSSDLWALGGPSERRSTANLNKLRLRATKRHGRYRHDYCPHISAASEKIRRVLAGI